MSRTEVKKSLRPLSSAVVVVCCLLACSAARAQEDKPAAKPAAKKPAATKKATPAEAKTAAAEKAAAQKTAPAKKKPAGAETTDAKASVEKSPADKSAADAEAAAEQPGKAAKGRQSGKSAADAGGAGVASKLTEEEAKTRLAAIQKLPSWERIAELEDLLDAELPDAAELRAIEQLVSALAAHGDERLQKGDAARGVELFRR
ncbi:MAG: hypothetical protein LC800_22700, partial [Acidobacteria bacterium]|nr:hypothetical protein [Acidobacteriota bacterium]